MHWLPYCFYWLLQYIVVWDAGCQTELTSRELFAEHFVPYPDAITTKSEQVSADTTDASFLFGMQAYARGEYDTALLILTAIHTRHPQDQTVSFYLANVKLAILGMAISGFVEKTRWYGEEHDSLNDVPEVTGLLLPVASGGGPYATPSCWYLALTSLVMEDPQMARHWLTRSLSRRATIAGEPIVCCWSYPDWASERK